MQSNYLRDVLSSCFRKIYIKNIYIFRKRILKGWRITFILRLLCIIIIIIEVIIIEDEY